MIRNRFAVLIASNQFQDSNLCNLEGPINDVESFDKILISRDYCNFTETHQLKNEKHYIVLQKIEEIFEKASKNDLVLIYFAGHGKADRRGKLYLTTTDTKIEKLKSTSVPLENIKTYIEDSKTNKVILILDCCLSAYNAITSLYKYVHMIYAWLKHIDILKYPYEFPPRLFRCKPLVVWLEKHFREAAWTTSCNHYLT